MKNFRIVFFWSLLFTTISYGNTPFSNPQNPNPSESNGVHGLLKRILPEHGASFKFADIDSNKGRDVFEIESVNDFIVIRGNNDIAKAVGLNHYLKYVCNTSVSWYVDDPVEVPKKLPKVPTKIRREAKLDQRFFLNYCTFAYTTPWWDWHDWERLIDWMALNGVTMPLATGGQEAIWYRVWRKYGLSDTQIRSYFTGPAHMPFNWMSVLDAWGGPLPKAWLDSQLDLHKKVVAREREFGMKPVLQAFAGHVPALLKDVRPEANISELGEWAGFEQKYRTYFLDPLDPLFQDIQKLFLEEQIKEFGTDHIYAADAFNEVDPPSWEPEYLENVAKTIYNSMSNVDEEAKWFQMTWIYYYEREKWTNERIKAMLRAVPQDRMVLLDYYSEMVELWRLTDSLFGQPYIWCYLGNFGGNTILGGNIREVSKRIDNTFLEGGENFNGLGCTLEGLDINPLMYEFVLEKAWNNDLSVDQWANHWADRRWGAINDNNRKAWEILLNKVYLEPIRPRMATLTNLRPKLYGHRTSDKELDLHYGNEDLLMALQLMLSDPSDRDVFQDDIISVEIQLLGNHFTYLRDMFTAAYEERNLGKLQQYGKQMLAVFDDMDSLLQTGSNTLLGKWIEDSKGMAANESEGKYYEKNAKNIITTWGNTGNYLNDYANRSWNGLMKNYYKIRWKYFIDDVTNAVAKDMEFDEKAFDKKMLKFEEQWISQSQNFTSTPKGNTIKIAKKLLNKYGDQIRNSSNTKL